MLYMITSMTRWIHVMAISSKIGGIYLELMVSMLSFGLRIASSSPSYLEMLSCFLGEALDFHSTRPFSA